MIKLFKVILSDLKILQYNWFCDKCDEVTVTETKGRGHYRYEDSWPTHTPTSKRCPNCGNWASFISVTIRQFWTRCDTGEEIFRITDYPGACYHDPAGVRDKETNTIRFGPDGECLILILPNNTKLFLDARSSSCSDRDDDKHRCRIRSGSIEDGNLSISDSFRGCSYTSGKILVDGTFYKLTNNVLEEV